MIKVIYVLSRPATEHLKHVPNRPFLWAYRSQHTEIPKQTAASAGYDAFRMKLHPVYVEAFVAHAHDPPLAVA